MILDTTLFDYVCVIKPVKCVIPVQACLFVLDCADIPVVKLNPLTTPLCVHDHSGKLASKIVFALSLSFTHTCTQTQDTEENTRKSYLICCIQRSRYTSSADTC